MWGCNWSGWGGGPTWPYPNNWPLNLDWMLARFKELIAQVDAMQGYIDTFKDQVQGIVDKAVAEGLIPVNAQIAAVSRELDTLGADLDQFKQDATLAHNLLSTQISTVDAKVGTLRADHAKDVADILAKIDALQWELPEVINPVTGEKDTIQGTLDSLYYESFQTWISPAEFDALNITPVAFDALQIAPEEYDRNAKTILDAAFGE